MCMHTHEFYTFTCIGDNHWLGIQIFVSLLLSEARRFRHFEVTRPIDEAEIVNRERESEKLLI